MGTGSHQSFRPGGAPPTPGRKARRHGPPGSNLMTFRLHLNVLTVELLAGLGEKSTPSYNPSITPSRGPGAVSPPAGVTCTQFIISINHTVNKENHQLAAPTLTHSYHQHSDLRSQKSQKWTNSCGNKAPLTPSLQPRPLSTSRP